MKHKLFFLSVSMLFIVLGSKAQTKPCCLHYPYNTQIGINLNANLLSKMRIEPQSDFFRSYPSLGVDLGVYLYQRVYKWFGVQIGIEYSHGFICYGGTENFTGLSKNDISMRYYKEMFVFPILFNASYYFNEKHGLDISLGGAPLLLSPDAPAPIGISYKTGFDAENENGDYYVFMLGDYPRFNFSLYGKVGYNFLFKNKNTLGVAIIGSYAANSYAQGRYTNLIVVDPIEDGRLIKNGKISLRNTFVGLQISYGFSMKKTLCKE